MAPRKSELVTVAAIRRPRNRPPRYLFYEHERIFTLAAGTRDAAGARQLERARTSQRPVRVTLDVDRGEVSEIAEASARDAAERAGRAPVARPSRIAPIDVA